MNNVKKIFCIILVFVVLIISIPSQAATKTTNITVKLNGKILTFEAKPRTINRRTLVPIAQLSKALGSTVEWIADTKSVIITQQTEDKNSSIYLKIGQASALVDGMEVKLDCKPVIYEGRTFVPLRFIAESFGAEVKWSSKTKTISITYAIPKQEKPPILPPPWELITGSAITIIN